MTAEVAAQNAAQVSQMVQVIKVTALWVLTGASIHFIIVQRFMIAWISSGNAKTMEIGPVNTVVSILIYLSTLALWLDKFNLL